MAAGVADLFLHLAQSRLTMLDGIPHPLTGDAEVFGYLREGEILVVVFGEDISLAYWVSTGP